LRETTSQRIPTGRGERASAQTSILFYGEEKREKNVGGASCSCRIGGRERRKASRRLSKLTTKNCRTFENKEAEKRESASVLQRKRGHEIPRRKKTKKKVSKRSGLGLIF